MDTKRDYAFLVSLILVLGFCFVASRSISEEARNGTRLIALPIEADLVEFLGDDERIALYSNAEQTLVLLDYASGEVTAAYDLTGYFESIEISDLLLSPDKASLFVIGSSRLDGEIGGTLIRVSLRESDLQWLRFDTEFIAPSAAIADDGRIALADAASPSISIIEPGLLREMSGKTVRRGFLKNNIFLDDGPVSRIGITRDGRFIYVSHIMTPKISLISVELREVVDALQARESASTALLMGRESGVENRVLFLDLDESSLVLADIDTPFESFGEVTLAPLGFERADSSPYSRRHQPAVLISSQNHEVIVAAQLKSRRIVFFSSVGRSIERPNIVNLKSSPLDIAVSPSGNQVALLNTEERALELIYRPLDWSSETGPLSGSERIRSAQQMLSRLHYPVGTIDGFDGPATQRALSIFQESVGLEPSGRVDDRTIRELEMVSAELPPVEFLGTSNDDSNLPKSRSFQVQASGRDCTPLAYNQLCSSRDPNTYSELPNLVTREVTCRTTEVGDAEVQIDTFDWSGKKPEYLCSSFHSCAYIRFRNSVAYEGICTTKEPKMVCRLREIRSLGWFTGHKTRFCIANGYEAGNFNRGEYKNGGICMSGEDPDICKAYYLNRLPADVSCSVSTTGEVECYR